MPLTVVVRSEGEPAKDARSLTFDGDRVVIGRGPGCDVRLPDPSVSHRHASLRVSGSDYTLVDEGSSNGTFAGGVRLAPRTPRTVKPGDLIRLGRVWLEIKAGQTAPTPDLGLATRDLALALVANAMARMGTDTDPRVVVVEGPDLGTAFPLAQEGYVYVVGRGERCDFLLEDPDCSREHVQIVRRGANVLVRDLSSRNGVILGDRAVAQGRDVPWRAQDVIRLGGTVIALEEPVASALAELERAPDEPLSEEEAPPPPPDEASTTAGTAIAAPSPGEARAPAAAVRERTVRTHPRRKAWTPTDLKREPSHAK